MSDPQTLLELAATQVEAATRPDRELDELIEQWRYGSWNIAFRPLPHRAPAYTASLDAAMTLVPEGWHVAQIGEGPSIEPRPRDFRYDGTGFAQLHYQRDTEDAPRLLYNLQWGSGATIALALTAACLRAKASILKEEGSRG